MNEDNLPVVVIGSGAGGLPAAVTLAELGIKTLLIERGGEFDVNTVPTDRYDYELHAAPWRQYHQEWQGPVEIQRGIGLGGSTLYFQAVSHMPDTSVLREWGLPIKAIMEIAEEVRDFLQIAGEVQPAHALNPVSKHLLEAARALKWQVRQAPVGILSKPMGDRPACNHCGQCIFGCKPQDKSSTNNTWLPRLKSSPHARVLTQTQVKFLELKDEKTLAAVHVLGPLGHERIPVRAALLAAGALETPYLLKSSQQALAPLGIGNKNVGHYLTGSLWHSFLVSQPQVSGGGYAGIPTDVLIEEFKEQGILLFQSRNMAGITGPVSAARFYANHFQRNDCRNWMLQHYPRLAGLAGFAESSTQYGDGLVLNQQKVFQKQLSDLDIEKTNKMRSLLEVWASQAKSQRLIDSGSIQHHISGSMLRGTCRIGPNAEDSATAPDGRLYGYDNIVISDASALGRGLIADPSWMLQALGVFLGRNLAERLKNTAKAKDKVNESI